MIEQELEEATMAEMNHLNSKEDESNKTFKEHCNFPIFQGSGNRHFLSFSPYTPMNPSKFGSCEDVNQAKLFLSTAQELKDMKSNTSEKRALFGIKKLTDLSQIVFINCVFGELVVLFEEEETKALILYHVGKFSNVNNISEYTTKITEIPLPVIPVFNQSQGTRNLTKEDLVFINFSCDTNRRVYFIQLRNGKVYARGTNTFNELGLTNRCVFVEEWQLVDFIAKDEYITTIKTNSHSSVFGTQNGKWYVCGKDAYFLRKRMIDFDDVQVDFIEADEMDPPYICSLEIPDEIIVSVQQLFVGTFLVTKSGKVYSTFRERLNIITDLLNGNSSHTLRVNGLVFNSDNERTNHVDTFNRECFLLDLPFPICEIRSIDNSMLVVREEDKRLFVSKKSNFIDLEISHVRRIINSTDEFFIVSKWNNIYSLYPSAAVPKLKAIELPRVLKQVPIVRPTKWRKTNVGQTMSSLPVQGTSSNVAEVEPVYNLWEACGSLEIRNILSMTTTFFVIVVEESKEEVSKHFRHSMTDNSTLILSDVNIIAHQ